jgi:soluble lytic murein transglycosylase
MSHRSTAFILTVFFLAFAALTASCSAQTEEQALASLRQMNQSGITPTDDYLSTIERRFSGKRAGALARLLHAKIKFDQKDFAGAAAILNSEDFGKTALADYALWLRGQALMQSGNNAEAMRVFERLIKEHPGSKLTEDARIFWADGAIAAGQGTLVPSNLNDLNIRHNANALLRTARAYEAQGNQAEAIKFYRRTYFYGVGTDAEKEAGTELTGLGQTLTPQSAEEATVRAEKLFTAKNYSAAEKAHSDLVASFPTSVTPATNLKRLTVYSNLKKASDAQGAFISIPASTKEKQEAYYQLTLAYARARLWPQARQTADEMRQKFPTGSFTPKAWVDAGMIARDAKSKTDEQYLLRAAVMNFPNAVEVASAQFELAWMQHDSGNFAESSRMFTEHLARYVDKDTTNRGKAGYWSARDSERSGKIAEACALYEGVNYRYSANWYGYLAQQRLANLKSQGQCSGQQNLPPGSSVPKAVANLRAITVAPETSTPRELVRVEKSEDLSAVGLFDWAIDELREAQETAENSPKINLALAKFYRLKGDNVNALLALAKSYPDYSQMFPEEMGREEWDIFYPLTNWNDIKSWARQRDLDHYQVAGLIRQESVFNPRAKSGANAYGLMQLLLPTARIMARKYGSSATPSSGQDLYNPALNIELGTAYMRDQFDKFGRIEYVAVAYNAGPNRVAPWRASLPIEMDEFVEAIPFKETRGYVQGVVRNSAQYRRLYDESGNFKSNVGTRPVRAEIDSRSREELAAAFPDISIEEIDSE